MAQGREAVSFILRHPVGYDALERLLKEAE